MNSKMQLFSYLKFFIYLQYHFYSIDFWIVFSFILNFLHLNRWVNEMHNAHSATVQEYWFHYKYIFVLFTNKWLTNSVANLRKNFLGICSWNTLTREQIIFVCRQNKTMRPSSVAIQIREISFEWIQFLLVGYRNKRTTNEWKLTQCVETVLSLVVLLRGSYIDLKLFYKESVYYILCKIYIINLKRENLSAACRRWIQSVQKNRASKVYKVGKIVRVLTLIENTAAN